VTETASNAVSLFLTLTCLALDASGMAGCMQEIAIRKWNYRNRNILCGYSRNKGAALKRVVGEKKARGRKE